MNPAVRPVAVAVSALAALLLAAGAGSDTAAVRPEAVRAHVEFLADDALNGRGSGTRDERIAATYAASQLRQFGVEPAGDAGGYVQNVDLVTRELAGPPSVVVARGSGPETRFAHGREVVVAAMAGPRVEAPLQKLDAAGAGKARAGAAVFLASGARDEAAGRSGIGAAIARGAAIVLAAADPQTLGRWPSLAARIPPLKAFLAAFGEAPAEGGPTVVLLDADTARIVGDLPDGSRVRVEGELKALERGATCNVVARLPGSDPKRASEAVLLSAHIDHLGVGEPVDGDAIYNGANDDASGVAAVLELARALAAGPRPKRTVLFALFGSEEQGGYGAAYFRERPPVPLDRIVANVEFEEIGRPDPKVPPHTLWLTGWERSDLGPSLVAHGARLVPDPHPEQDFFRRSDNYVFARRGVIAHTVSSDALYAQYHRPSDEPGILDYGHMAEAIGSLIEPIRWLLDSDFRPRWLPGGKP